MDNKKNAKVIAFANQKGGVGKTMSTENIGVALANKNKRVLIIDLDAQANLTSGFGYDSEKIEYTISDLLEKIVKNDGELSPSLDLTNYLLHTKEGVDLLPSDINLAGVETSFSGVEIGREQLLKQAVDVLRPIYDFILLDCPPSLGSITVNSLTASDAVIIPMQAAKYSFDGSKQLIRVISKVKKLFNFSLRIDGILITMFDQRTRHGKEITKGLEEVYGDVIKIFDSKIPYSVRASESNFEGVSIFAHDPKGKIAKAYQDCVEEMLYGDLER